MNEFYNPFHFVPIGPPPRELMPREALKSPPPERDQHTHDHVTHDRYVEHTYSGRIVCRLKLDTPTVLGARRNPSPVPAVVEPYEILAERGGKLQLEPAIPATSLRGMISSVFESITSSALRVLNDTPLSIRARAMRVSDAEPSEALQAVGMIHVDGNKRHWLLPLAFPVLPESRSSGDQWGRDDERRVFDIEPLWRPYENFMAVKVYLGQQDDISTTADDLRIYFLEDPGFPGPREHRITGGAGARNKGGLIGRFKHAHPLTRDQWLAKPEAERRNFVPGVIRNLGVESCAELQAARAPEDNQSRRATKELPGNVKYGWFIPLHPSVYNPDTGDWVYRRNHLIDAEKAVKDFEALAEQRTLADLRLPFELSGSLRSGKAKQKGENATHVIKLRHGDLVCFELVAEEQIGRLSISSIWRKPAGDVWEWFAGIDPNLVPMNPQRTQVTLAEQLFGFVETGDQPETTTATRIKALAGRLTFSEGRLCSPAAGSGAYEAEGTTPILAAPKPPGPLFYFQQRDGGAVTKAALPSRAGRGIRPKGRKWYLHHRQILWQTVAPDKDKRQKTRLRPLKAGLEFIFDVGFINLSETELALLVYALHPTDAFRHRLGLGKPLGLGTVHVQPAGVFFVDRRSRYQDADLFGLQRYHRVAVCAGQPQQTLQFPHAADDVQGRYAREAAAWPAAPGGDSTWSDLHQKSLQLLKEWKLDDVRAAVESLGDPATTGDTPIHYPRLPDELLPKLPDGRPNPEGELFRWHMWNEERPSPQSLKPLSREHAAPNVLERVAPFKFFVYSTLNEQQRRDVFELLEPVYPGGIVPAERGLLQAHPDAYREEILKAQRDGLICVHLGIRQTRDWPRWAETVSNHKPIDGVSGRNQIRTNFRDKLKKYLPGSDAP